MDARNNYKLNLNDRKVIIQKKQGNKAEEDNCMKREMLVRKYLFHILNKMQKRKDLVIN